MTDSATPDAPVRLIEPVESEDDKPAAAPIVDENDLESKLAGPWAGTNRTE